MARENRKIRGLVMPGDAVIPSGKLKKQLLFFDQVILSDPRDRALIADRELQHLSADGSMFFWEAERGPFPRQDNYEARFAELLQGTEQLQRNGKLRVLTPGDWNAIDPWLRMCLHNSAIADGELVRSAIPDYADKEPIKTPDGVIYAQGVWHLKGQCPIPMNLLRTDPPYKIPDVDDRWHTLAYLRLGRTVKYVRVAQITDAVPVAWDDSTCGILVALGRLAFRELPSPETLAGAAIELDVVKPQELEAALEEMPWGDVIRIRKEILPYVAQYRSKVIETARHVHMAQTGGVDIDRYRSIVKADRQSLNSAQEALFNAWQGLKIVAALKGLAGALGGGAMSLIIPTDWMGLLGTVLTGLALGAGTMPSEIKNVLQTRENVRKNPLFVMDRSLSKIR